MHSYCRRGNLAAFKHNTLDSCRLRQVSQLYAVADSIKWGWEDVWWWGEVIRWGCWSGLLSILVWIQSLRALGNSPNWLEELGVGLWLAALSFLRNERWWLGGSWLKHVTFYWELDRPFPISSFSLNDVFPALDRIAVLNYVIHLQASRKMSQVYELWSLLSYSELLCSF